MKVGDITMKVKELITLLLNEPMDNEMPDIEGIEKPFFGQDKNTTYLKIKGE